MSMITTDRMTSPVAANSGLRPVAALRRDGVVGLFGRLRHRNAEAYEAWLEERDMIIITATLMRLNERQLSRIGMARGTLALDVDDLALRCARERALGDEVLELVGAEEDGRRAIAAE